MLLDDRGRTFSGESASAGVYVREGRRDTAARESRSRHRVDSAGETHKGFILLRHRGGP